MEKNCVWHRHVPDSRVHGANMGPIWGRQDPGGMGGAGGGGGGVHVGTMNFAIWDILVFIAFYCKRNQLLNNVQNTALPLVLYTGVM